MATTHGCSVSAIIDETLASRSNFVRAVILLFDLVVSQGGLVVVGTVLKLGQSLHILRLLELLRSQFALDLEQLRVRLRGGLCSLSLYLLHLRRRSRLRRSSLVLLVGHLLRAEDFAVELRRRQVSGRGRVTARFC